MRPLLIFDLDGTLAHTAPDLIATLNRVTQRCDVHPVDETMVGQIIGFGAKAMIARAFDLSAQTITEAELDALFFDFLDDYSVNLANKTDLFEGLLDALDKLEAAGHAFSVCTNKKYDMAILLLQRLDVLHRFKSVTGGDSFSFKKPDGRHLVETARLAGFSIDKAMMIGDSGTDITAAQDADIPSIAVTFGYSNVPVEQLGADQWISHFDQLAAAVAAITK